MPEVAYPDLPVDLKRVIQGVRGAEVQLSQYQRQYHKEVYELERKWHKKYQTVFDRRAALLSGGSPPTADEVSAGEQRSKEQNNDYQKLPALRGNAKSIAVDSFWLRVLKGNLETSAWMRETDERALSSLTNIAIAYPQGSKMAEWALEFSFAKNNFFSNNVLRLTYVFRDEVDSDGDLKFSHVTGDTIQWKPKQNLVKNNSSKKQNDDEDDEQEDRSFFSLFSPPAIISKPAKAGDDDEERLLELDQAFEVGLTIKQTIMSRATDYFIGDAEDTLDDDLGDDDDDDWSGYGDSDSE